MNIRTYENTVQTEKRLPGNSQVASRIRPLKAERLLVFLLLIIFFLPQTINSQASEVFDVNKLIYDLRKRFKLSASDLRNIRPLINEENKNILQIYARFSGDEPEYSDVVWRQIIERRLEFETQTGRELSKRQKAALRAGRTRLEKCILNYLTEDYVIFLGRFLDLDEWEFKDVQDLFESENERKYKLVTEHLSNPVFLQMELEKISEETDRRMQKILSGEQLRDYRSLAGPTESIALLRH